jgi:hypothetical protein
VPVWAALALEEALTWVVTASAAMVWAVSAWAVLA